MSYVVGNPLLKESGGHSVEYEALRGQPGPNSKTSWSTWGMVALGAGCCTLVLYFIIAGAAGYQPSHGSTSYSAIIQTTNGPVQGMSYAANGTDYRIEGWKGIPFAEPPVGNLRWKMPEPLSTQWEEALEATSLKPACVQPDGSGEEDCLYLNIYRNENPSDKGPYPVLFYIYGGGLMSGQANNNFDSLIVSNDNAGMVVVEVGYRLNAFGFMAIEELSEEQGGSSGNYGIMDQLLALSWVKSNIAEFGGDPDRVTLSGQSSGGTSIMALLSVPSAKGLFAGAISMSGSPNISMPLSVAEAQNSHFAASCAGGGGTSSEAVLSCMRNLSVESLVSAIPSAWNMPGIWNLPKGPTGQQYEGLVIVDGTLIQHDFATALSVGTVDVPFIYGNMQCESDEGPEMDVTAYSLEQWAQLLNSTFSSWSEPNVGNTIYNLYASAAADSPQKAFDEIVSDYGLFCGQLDVAREALGGFDSPIYIYDDQWGLSQPYTSPWTGTTVAWPFHDTLFFMVTGQWNLVGDMGTYEPSQRDLEGQALLQSIFRYFMNHQTLSGSDFGWEPVNNSPDWASSDKSLPYGNYSVFVIDPNGSQTLVNHKEDVCKFFHEIGLDRREFWWAN